MKMSDLHGTWNLKSIYSQSKSGNRNFHFGEDAVGRLTYTPNGFMHAFIMKRDRPTFEGGGIDEGTSEEIRSAFQDFDAYSGRYTVDLSAGTVVHHVDMARSPAWVGLDLMRFFKIEDQTLSIYTDEFYWDSQGEDVVVFVEWERL